MPADDPFHRHSSDRIITVAVFGNAAEAAIARSVVEDAGIRTSLDGELTSVALSLYAAGLTGVKLLVAEADAARAAAALAERLDEFSNAGSLPGSSWHCPTCDQVIDGTFQVCWSCGRFAGDEGDPDDDDTPARHIDAPPLTPDLLALRALRTALWCCLFPPAVIYLICLITTIPRNELSEPARRNLSGAIALGSLVAFFSAAILAWKFLY